MEKISFDPNEEDCFESVKAIVLERLRRDTDWKRMDLNGLQFDNIVEYVGDPKLGRERLVFMALEILGEFMSEGIIAPGSNIANPTLPHFHITEYGHEVLSEEKYLPYEIEEFGRPPVYRNL